MKPQLITKTGRKRMRKMIGYLRNLPTERFDFDTIAVEGKCGTVGCVIGHAPNLFPELCEYRPDFAQYLRVGMKGDDSWQEYANVGAELFRVSSDTATELFTPTCQQVDSVKLPRCEWGATPTEVADMLESFLAQVDDKPE